MTVTNNELEFYMNQPYYVISGLSLDVERDYLPADETTGSIEEIEQYIETHNIQAREGVSLIQAEDIIYVPRTGSIEYAETLFHYASIADEM